MPARKNYALTKRDCFNVIIFLCSCTYRRLLRGTADKVFIVTLDNWSLEPFATCSKRPRWGQLL